MSPDVTSILHTNGRVLLGDMSPHFSAMNTLTVLTESLTRPNVYYSTAGNIPQQIHHLLVFV